MVDQNARLGLIIRVIANNAGITLTGLNAELAALGVAVTERTLAKDILKLKTEYGLLPKKERLRRGYFLEGIYSLSHNEVALVLDAMHVFGVHLNDPEAHALMERISRLVAESSDAEVLSARLERTVRQRDIYKSAKKSNVQETLLAAIRSRLPVKILYDTPRLKEPKQFKGYPLLLVFYERGWYCITRDLVDQNYAPRRIDRIRECSLLDRSAVNTHHEENLTEAQYLMYSGWGMSFARSMDELKASQAEPEIVVRFDVSIASYILEAVERHPLGKVARAKDGSGGVDFRIRLHDATEFVYWVRSFGAKARLLAPRALVEKERAEILRMSRNYGS